MAKSKVNIAFQSEGVTLELSQLLPTRLVHRRMRELPKYRRILSSIQVLGIIEPPMVYPHKQEPDKYLLLDGHLRIRALEELGETSVYCLIATDDEAFTYNHKVNQLSPIQEHFMILKALDQGVSEDRIAVTLNVDVARIRDKRDLLHGICDEAVALLKTERIAAAALREMRRVKPMRQIEIAELMIASRNFSKVYAQCLVTATPAEQLNDPKSSNGMKGVHVDDVARIKRELQGISDDFRAIEEAHGQNVLNLVIAVGFLKRLLDNATIIKYLAKHHNDVLEQFQQIVDDSSLNDQTQPRED